MKKLTLANKLPAFTLIEILVVATIIILLTAISVSAFSVANKSARDSRRKTDLETIRQSMVLYKAQNAKYPGDVSLLSSGTTKYITPPFPIDPNGASYQVTSTITDFCFCADVELDKGNHTTANCTSGAWQTTPLPVGYYCVQQPY